MDIALLEQEINLTKEKFLQDKGKYENLVSIKKSKENEIENLKKKENLDKARIFLIKSAEYQRQQIKTEFEEMVSQSFSIFWKKKSILKLTFMRPEVGLKQDFS